MKRCPKCKSKLQHSLNDIHCNRCGYSKPQPESVREMRMTDHLLKKWIYADIETIIDCYSGSEVET
jgi:hypothetical protein